MENKKDKEPLEEQLQDIIRRKSEENVALNKLLEQLENSKENKDTFVQHPQDNKSKKNLK